MIRITVAVLFVLHGLIHLLGFAKAFELAEMPQLVQPISRPAGLLWLTAALLCCTAAAALFRTPRWWWALGGLAVVISQAVIVSSWDDAKVGTLANVVLLLAVLYGFASRGPLSLRAEFEHALKEAWPPAQSSSPGDVTEDDLAPLPDPVQRYLRRCGVVGRPPVRDFRATWTGRIRGDPDAAWMTFTADQLDIVDTPRRFFMMDARMKGLPVDVLHVFNDDGATMRVRLLSVRSMVDAKGAALTRAETVTLFNDLCCYAPSALVSPDISWEPIDERAAAAHFTLGVNTVAAELRFDDSGDLVDFVADGRSAMSADGRSLTPLRWSTPLRDYAQLGPARVATKAEVKWHPQSGAWTYGEFELTSLAYNVADTGTPVAPRTQPGAARPQLVWLGGGLVLGFAVPFLFADVLQLPRDLYYGIYAASVLIFVASWAAATGQRLDLMLRRRRRLAVVLGVACALVLAVVVVRTETPTARPEGLALVWAVLWRGVVYGAVDGLLLSVFPILAVFAATAGSKFRTRKFGTITVAAAALLASLVMTVVYHLGYSDFRSAKLAKPLTGDLVWSVPTLVTLNPIGAPIAHAGLHVAAVLHSYDTETFLPPHR
ncbi:MAG: hypothetical protein M3Z25_20025 [Actinomycetota bacterium]|nr:hypothetical protein [Actinomycetota bacterium]